MKKILRNPLFVLALCACAPGATVPENEIVLLEKPGSRALAEATNLQREGKLDPAREKYAEALKSTQDPTIKATALRELSELASKEHDPAKQADLLKQAVALGDAKSSYRLARLNKLHVQPHTVELLSAMAEQGDPDAMLAVARIHADGLNGAVNTALGETWYRRAIEAGSLSAAVDLGRRWAQPASGHAPSDALALFSQVAKHDQLAVARDIAQLYEHQGHQSEAIKWYEVAAKQTPPSTSVFNKLARAYHEGQGVEQNDSTALKWSLRAAEVGSFNAAERVMRAHFNGFGTPANTEEGMRWLEWIVAQKPERLYSIAKDFSTGDGLPRLPSMAHQLALRAAGQGDTRAMRFVAYGYERGDGVKANPAQARHWFSRAGIVRKAPKARTTRTLAPQNPLITQATALEAEGNPEEALALYKKAANAGDTTAMLRVAAAYAAGMGTGQDPTEASRWYAKAAQQGNPEGQYRLGIAFARGNGIGKDMQKARYWLEKAAGGGYPQAQETLKTFLKEE